MMRIFYHISMVALYSISTSASADIGNEYRSQQQSERITAERCRELRRLGNYAIEGGGSWNPEYYLDGTTIYRPTKSQSCDYEWERLASLDIQRDDTYSNGINSTCTESLLFKKKGTDLISFKKSGCSSYNENVIEKQCYVPIDWKQGDRKYPYCGCFDNPVPEWMASSGYCKNATGSNLGGVVNDLFNTLFRKR